MPVRNSRVKAFRTNTTTGEVVATVAAKGIHPKTRKASAKITLEVLLPAVPNENPRTTSRRAKDDGLQYVELRDSFY